MSVIVTAFTRYLGFALVCSFFLYCEAKGNHPEKSDWASFKAFHKKSYHNSSQESFHRGHFEKAAKNIARHNKLFKLGLVKYEKELNRFADEDVALLKKRRGFKKSNNSSLRNTLPLLPRNLTLIRVNDLPASFDWRDQNAVSPVKYQGFCGNCWAFSATGSLESQVYLASDPKPGPGQMRVFSVQQLTDCDHFGQDDGCNGGNYENAWNYIKSVGGIETEAAYPFTSGPSGVTGKKCLFNSTNKLQTLSSYLDLPEDETMIQQYLVTVGPLSISFDASDMDYYSSGIVTCPGNYSVNHAVLLVGYGTDDAGTPYWIAKNQWSTGWGMKGYFYLLRGSNACGVQTNAACPIL